MAITHKAIFARLIQGNGLIEVANAYRIPLTTVEHVLHIRLADRIYSPPKQMTLEPEKAPQMTISEVYGTMEIQ